MRAPKLTFKRARHLRREMTLPEVLLWRDLRGGALGKLRFRRQHPARPYVLDFFCPEVALAVEIDGAAHDIERQALRDADRDRWLADHGTRVLRFNAPDVLDDRKRPDVLATIMAAAVAPSTALTRGPPPPSATGEDHVLADAKTKPDQGEV